MDLQLPMPIANETLLGMIYGFAWYSKSVLKLLCLFDGV
jgi:uncharacterized membrane protein YpjA